MGGRRKSRGNFLTKGFARVVDKAAPEILDDVMDVATGRKRRSKHKAEADPRPTDWATRVPAARKRRTH